MKLYDERAKQSSSWLRSHNSHSTSNILFALKQLAGATAHNNVVMPEQTSDQHLLSALSEIEKFSFSWPNFMKNL